MSSELHLFHIQFSRVPIPLRITRTHAVNYKSVVGKHGKNCDLQPCMVSDLPLLLATFELFVHILSRRSLVRLGLRYHLVLGRRQKLLQRRLCTRMCIGAAYRQWLNCLKKKCGNATLPSPFPPSLPSPLLSSFPSPAAKRPPENQPGGLGAL